MWINVWTCAVYQYMDVCRISVCGSICGRVLYISMWTCAECAVYQEGGVNCVSVCGSICGRVQNISMWTCADYQYVDQSVDVCRISVCGRVGRGVEVCRIRSHWRLLAFCLLLCTEIAQFCIARFLASCSCILLLFFFSSF